ncbi:MAG: AtpZ/AtpI family protein [Ignavibacteria bacterium]|nr:AtpZ/AtpI family protein [Ignavibacteria bacterium]
MKNSSEKKVTKVLIEVAPYMNLSWQMLITIGIFIFIGWYIDNRFGTKPIFILVFSFLGIALAFYNFFRTVNELGKRGKKDK